MTVHDNTEQFSPPVINHSRLIERPELMERISEQARRGILFIHAPAGYGKTTAAVQWSDALPLLQKVLNRLKYGYDAEILDKAFVNLLYIRAREVSKHTQGTLLRGAEKPVKLSPRQTEVVRYLIQNLSYREISEKMKVTVAAVDYHIRVLHGKFEVTNTRDLLQKARELGVINME